MPDVLGLPTPAADCCVGQEYSLAQRIKKITKSVRNVGHLPLIRECEKHDHTKKPANQVNKCSLHQSNVIETYPLLKYLPPVASIAQLQQ